MHYLHFLYLHFKQCLNPFKSGVGQCASWYKNKKNQKL